MDPASEAAAPPQGPDVAEDPCARRNGLAARLGGIASILILIVGGLSACAQRPDAPAAPEAPAAPPPPPPAVAAVPPAPEAAEPKVEETKPRITYSEAVRWYSTAAEGGDPTAQFLLAIKYERGIDVERDMAKALHWFERAAAQEFAEAQFKLGVLYSQAESEFHDPTAAARWTEASARTGYAPAQYNMGVAYLNGAGVPADPVRALAWLELAAASGLEQATALRLRLLDALPEAQIVEGRRLADDIAGELGKRR